MKEREISTRTRNRTQSYFLVTKKKVVGDKKLSKKDKKDLRYRDRTEKVREYLFMRGLDIVRKIK